VVLRYYEDMTEAEVAERLGVSLGTVKSTVSRAVAKLRIDAELLATGYRYEPSAEISVTERPDAYRALATGATTGGQERDEQDRLVVGSGDNVFRTTGDVVGTARFIRSVDTVMEMLVEGVPPETVAVIDDSGGTLTAPILEHFTAVLCMGGTVRSHLGILTREYGVPCLMAVEIHGLNDGDRVQVEYTKRALEAGEYTHSDPELRARIWKLDQ
jgi:phosphohistidine swiveling domain-containing protein